MSQLTVHLNGESRTVASFTIEDLLQELSISTKGVAVAVQGEIVPKSLWHTHRIALNDHIEIVTAVAGG
jgi:sulfur carrier protein